jgi:hypothetical protein
MDFMQKCIDKIEKDLVMLDKRESEYTREEFKREEFKREEFKREEDVMSQKVDAKKKDTFTTKVFRLPIETIQTEKVHTLSTIVADDLELVKTTESCNMYSHLFNVDGETEDNLFARELIPSCQKFYTTNTQFLKDSQTVIDNVRNRNPTPCAVTNARIKANWVTVRHDDKFCEHYGYLEWEMLKHFNTNASFLQSLSIAHILSPLMSFFVPLLFLIFPFIILKMQRVPISFFKYIEVLKNIAKNHFIGKAIMTMDKVSVSNIIYLVSLLGLYLMQMYNNSMQCIRFYRNTQKMNEELCDWKTYISHNVEKMESFLKWNGHLETYKPFCKLVAKHHKQLSAVLKKLHNVCPFTCSLAKSVEIGYMLECFYELHSNTLYEESILFCFGFDGYYQLLEGASRHLESGFLNRATFYLEDEEEEDETTAITDQFYPSSGDECVKNDVTLDKNIILTGPNASGKTTLLKSTAINIIFTQQFGIGFYKSCKLQPYHNIHSYLNIPDTSGRDSLFQAESRRCKDILDSIAVNGPESRHFCIFDELYSGTNPNEATKTAFAFMKYISSFKNVDLILTTHYVSICTKLERVFPSRISNYQMEVLEVEHVEENTYKIIKGISTREGAIKILREMKYPEQILESFHNMDVVSDQDQDQDQDEEGILDECVVV